MADTGIDEVLSVDPELYNTYTIKEQSPMTIAMCNMTAVLGGFRLNIPELVSQFPAAWNPAVFATATLRMLNPQCCILMFSTGKVVCTGAPSEVSAMYALSKFITIVQQTYVNATLLNVRIELMTARCSVGFPLDLKKMESDNVVECTLDELFPALRWYKEIENTEGKKPTKITLLVFCNGNIVVLGSKSRYQLLYMQEEINRTMPKYRCSHEDMIRYQENKKSKTKSSKRARAGGATGGQKPRKRPATKGTRPSRK